MVRRTRDARRPAESADSRAAVPEPQAGSPVRMGTPPDGPGAGLPKTPKGTPCGPGVRCRNTRPDGAKPTGGWAAEVPPGTDGRDGGERRARLRDPTPRTPAGVRGRRTAERRTSAPDMRTKRDRADAPMAAPRRGGTQPKTWKRDRSPGQHRPTGADGPTPPRGDALPRPRSRSHTGALATGSPAPPGRRRTPWRGRQRPAGTAGRAGQSPGAAASDATLRREWTTTGRAAHPRRSPPRDAARHPRGRRVHQ